MKSPKPNPTPDTDTTIASLRFQVTAMQTELRAAEAVIEAWRKQGEDARAVAVDVRKLLDKTMEARVAAVGQLRFAEGYLAAFKGESYQRSDEP